MTGASVFETLLQGSYLDLSVVMQRVHDARSSKYLHGRCDVVRGSGWLVKWLAPIASLPPSANGETLTVTIDTDAEGETWTRNFNGHCMQSRIRAQDGLLAERLGAMMLLFTLQVAQGCIVWRVAGAKFLGVPLPASWFAGACATERVIDGRYTFDVRASLPVVGLLVHYHGWLTE